MEKITLSNLEYSALMNIRGTPDKVHDMIFGADNLGKDWELEGDEEAFDELLSTISEEICYELSSKKSFPALLRICKKVDPESLDWVGM